LDAAADWVKQRDFAGWLGHREYSTVTALASLNYRMAHGVTGTLRAGRFLARDEGVRAELKRRFASGVEMGAWYTVTNGRDITSPGTPSSPYHDKGIFVSIPLDTMLTYDTQAGAGFALSPWTRDVGQMVASPGDLYRILERPSTQMHERDGLVRFGDREDDYDLPSLGTGRDRRWPDLVAEDFFGAARAAQGVDWLKTAALGAGLVVGSAALDERAFRFADKRRNAGWMKQGVRASNALPVAALGLAAVLALDESRPRLSDTGLAALEAGAATFVAAEALKYGFGRARPATGQGNREFEPGNSQDRFHAFPSRHTALAWAALTPYAKEYDAPWLYGVAALSNVGRTASREHWFSDTVAGAALGYALGHLAWEARRSPEGSKDGPKLQAGLSSLALRWELP
jgi:membrane-associated phospholipid phosphatase